MNYVEDKGILIAAPKSWFYVRGGSARQWIAKTQDWIEEGPSVLRIKKLPKSPKKIDLLPSELSYISDVIDSSFSILKLGTSCEEEGIPAYKEKTLKRAIKFLENHAVWLWKNHGICIDAPKILPGPNGGIDLLWKTDTYELLVNIPEDPNKPADFYGDDRGQIYIKGTLNPTEYSQGLLIWLQKKK